MCACTTPDDGGGGGGASEGASRVWKTVTIVANVRADVAATIVAVAFFQPIARPAPRPPSGGRSRRCLLTSLRCSGSSRHSASVTSSMRASYLRSSSAYWARRSSRSLVSVMPRSVVPSLRTGQGATNRMTRHSHAGSGISQLGTVYLRLLPPARSYWIRTASRVDTPHHLRSYRLTSS